MRIGLSVLTILGAVLFCYGLGCFGFQDVSPPVLSGFSFSPATVNTSSGPQTVTVTMQITDALSGFDKGSFSFFANGAGQTASAYITAANRIAGDANNGTYAVPVTFPQYSFTGGWYCYSIGLYDRVGNCKYITRGDTAFGSYSTIWTE